MHRIFRVKAYEAEHGPHFNEEHARKAVSKMENEDGTRGPHWSIEETTTLANQYGISLGNRFNRYDWFVALNMVYSDYYKVIINITNSNSTKHFVELVPLLITKETVPEFIFQNNEFFQYNDLQTLMDCGIVNSSDGLYTYTGLDQVKLPGFKLVSKNYDVKELQLEGFALTDAGLQLCQLIECNYADENYVKQLVDRLSRRNNKEISYKKLE